MKRSTFTVLLVSALLALVISSLGLGSCVLGIEPAWKASGNDAVVSFSINAPMIVKNEADGRAVFLSPGYLYIRTVGGPTGERGPFYGPYEISPGKAFSTVDIPAGNYEGIGVLYTAEKLDEKVTPEITGPNVGKTFVELMSLPDEQFNIFTDQEVSPYNVPAMNILIDGQATGQYLKNVTIVAGVANVLPVTLSPICGPLTTIELAYQSGSHYWTPITFDIPTATMKRVFLKIRNTQLPAGYKFPLISCGWQVTGSAEVGSVGFYSDKGKLLGSVSHIGLVTDPFLVVKETPVSWTQYSEGYFYLEYSLPVGSTLICHFNADYVPM